MEDVAGETLVRNRTKKLRKLKSEEKIKQKRKENTKVAPVSSNLEPSGT